ncbi:MAG: hypothetical protein F4X11_10800 [Acidobacteria bacterium]|nr:hypothetical protein [Acidobacteriota bacterium]
MIVCLGWGSLIWDPRELPVGEWHREGPAVNVEFVRQSSGDRLTRALDGAANAVPSLWARMTENRLAAAVRALAARERITGSVDKNIGRWSAGKADPPNISDLGSWAAKQGVDHVIWTALGAKFQGEDGRAPSAEEAVAYLQRLAGEGKADNAQEYVCKAPVDTVYRRRIVRSLGWTPVD